jgi:hypothetical protein
MTVVTPLIQTKHKPAEDDPDVIPLEISGTIDMDMSKMSANDMMAWGLANLWKEGKEGVYGIRPGRQPISDFPSINNDNEDEDEPNFFERAFPCLFPYGRGGMEARRPRPISLRDHVQWAIQYADHRFRKHVTFPYVVFGIIQRREALGSARVQMKRENFDRDARIFAKVTMTKLRKASDEEDRNQPISDPHVRLLRKHVHATISRVSGSDQQRQQLRSQIWSTCVSIGPPSLWITINPCDLHDPIAQIFTGEKINLDDFLARNGPTKEQRAKNIADDPYAAAKFFNFMINTILETLFQVKVVGHQVKSRVGILGRVSAYFCTVECQQRGTLHMHGLAWLANSPTADEMEELLKSAEFRDRIVAYIKANLRAYVPGLDSAESVKAIPVEKDIAYSRPINPDADDYDENLQSFERRLARAEQIHTCKVRRCLIPDKTGRLKCKRKAPFQCSSDDFVTETGEWGPKRLYGYTNGWIPGILLNARCNNDGKFLTNGHATKAITYYVSSYAAKKQGRNDNTSRAMSRGFAYHLEHPNPEYETQLKRQAKLLIFRVTQAIHHEQELAGPMILTLLMKLGDVFRSHTYSTVFWSSFLYHLMKAFPSLVRKERYASHVL